MNITKRKNILKNLKRVVVKVGTRLLTDELEIPLLIPQIASLRNKGYDVILVSSGAVGMGMKAINLEERPAELAKKQALAAIGQSKLMAKYEEECSKFNFHSAQLLLTADALLDLERANNIKNCINSLLEDNILPIINENDSVATEELKFGDNDTLATKVAVSINADLLILLTTVDGLHSVVNGELDKRISVVENIDKDIEALAKDSDDEFSIGGMKSKLDAAKIAMKNNLTMWIADGRESNIVDKILNNEDVGTIFIKG